jgi:hypothetical protein
VRAGTVELSEGEHRVELRRPGASLAPGDGVNDTIAQAVLAPMGEPRLVRAPAGDPDRLCGRTLDWVEAG